MLVVILYFGEIKFVVKGCVLNYYYYFFLKVSFSL